MRLLTGILAAMMLASPAWAQTDRPEDWVPPPPESVPNHREMVRDIVGELAGWAKKLDKSFIVLARGGVELLVKGEREVEFDEIRDPHRIAFDRRLPPGYVFRSTIKLLDGLVLNGLYCGPYAFDKKLTQAIEDRKAFDAVLADERKRGIFRPPVAVPLGPFSIEPETERKRHTEWRKLVEHDEGQRRILYAVDAMMEAGRRIFSVEDCTDRSAANEARRAANRDRVTSFIGVGKSQLNRVPAGHAPRENPNVVTALSDVRNWLPTLSGDSFVTKEEWLLALEHTNHDLVIIDVAHQGTDPMTKDDVKRLKHKQLGPSRLVFAVMSIGKAHDGRWYWQPGWRVGEPDWLVFPVPGEPGAYFTALESMEWRKLLGRTMAGIVELGFDGVLFDDLDTYLWFEDVMPLTN